VLLKRERELLGRFARFARVRRHFTLIRCHGDYHLGQVLDTGDDFVISDFEGEPTRTLAARRRRQSPLRDVAGMLRSFHYAALTALAHAAGHPEGSPAAHLEPWASAWYERCSQGFLEAYFAEAGAAAFLPADAAERAELLALFMLEKAVYELGYEAGNRPEWLDIPLQGLTQLLDGGLP
jgi:maltose alpha-D-glucosyltransferase/alpha-amylase